MKYLYIIRHAKAEPSAHDLDDHDRKLVAKGINRANSLSNWLKNKTPNIEKIYCSSSKRTIETADILVNGLSKLVNRTIDKELYAASEEKMINYISLIEDKINSVGLVGHQPGLQELAYTLVGNYAEGYDKVLDSNFSTSSAILVGLNIKRWDQVSPRVGILADYFDSKNS
jgi:phosphohistidine phosphatase